MEIPQRNQIGKTKDNFTKKYHKIFNFIRFYCLISTADDRVIYSEASL